MKLELLPPVFEESSNNKFHRSPSGKSRIVSCGRKDGLTDRETDMAKSIVACRNVSDTPKTLMHR